MKKLSIFMTTILYIFSVVAIFLYYHLEEYVYLLEVVLIFLGMYFFSLVFTSIYLIGQKNLKHQNKKYYSPRFLVIAFTIACVIAIKYATGIFVSISIAKAVTYPY